MAKIEEEDSVRFEGLLGGKNASSVAFLSDRVLVVADEMTDDRTNVVQAFDRKGNVYRPLENGLTELDAPGTRNGEMDLEGICVDDRTVYVLGSHSARRQRLKATLSQHDNREALMSPTEAQPSRDVLLRFTLDEGGEPGAIERTSLRDFLESTEPFAPFLNVASKENGVDAEGLAIQGDWLYVGFRGPVLRGNYTPILKFRFGEPIEQPSTLFVDIGGRGVRDLTAVEDGFFILAGPVGDGPGSYALYHWDGEDGVPGNDVPAGGGARLIGDLPMPGGGEGKAEGLALVEEDADHWKLLVVFDGLKNGHATHYRVEKAG